MGSYRTLVTEIDGKEVSMQFKTDSVDWLEYHKLGDSSNDFKSPYSYFSATSVDPNRKTRYFIIEILDTVINRVIEVDESIDNILPF